MKRLVSSVAILILFLVFSATAQPKLEIIGGDTYDWGTVSPTEGPFKANIKLKNTGNELLKITLVKASCGCTSAPLNKDELKPGETAELDIELRAGSTSRSLTKTVRIESNDPKTPRKILYLKATVVNPLDLSPSRYFSFEGLRVGQESKSTLTLTNKSDRKVTISDFNLNNDNARFNLSKPVTLKPGEKVDLTVSVKPAAKGHLNVKLTMKTSHPDYKEIIIYGSGRVAESAIFNN